MPPDTSQATRLLRRWSVGDGEARDQLIPLVYDRLRQLAHHRLLDAPGEPLRRCSA